MFTTGKLISSRPKAEKQRQIPHIGRHVAADPDPFTCRPDFIDDAPQQTDKAGTRLITKPTNTRSFAISSKEVLGQVICADAEKIYFGAELIKAECRCGYFEHDANGNVFQQAP
jgi:hypothetical protein